MWRSLAALTLALCTAVFGDPRIWEPSGVTIRGEGPVFVSSSATNANGLTLVVWVDEETGQGDVWGQLLNQSGAPLWQENGRRLITTTTGEHDVSTHAWQDGFVLMFDRENGNMNGADLFMLVIDANGNALWPQNGFTGVRVSDEGTYGGSFHQVRVHDSGVIDFAYGDWDVYYESFSLHSNRIGTDGALFHAESVLLRAYGSLGTSHGVDFDDEGNIYLAWSERVGIDSSQYQFEKRTSSGELIWQQIIPVIDSREVYIRPHFVIGGGCYVAWRGNEQHPDALLLQLHDESGTAQWPEPMVVEVSWTRSYSAGMMTDQPEGGSSAVFISWLSRAALPSDSGAVEIHKIGSDGSRYWGQDGIEMCSGVLLSSVTRYAITGDGSGGVLAMIQNYEPNGAHYAYANRILRLDSTGEQVWGEPCGLQLTPTGETHSEPQLVTGGDQYAVVSWYQYSDTNIVRTLLVNKSTGDTAAPAGGGIWAGGLPGGVNELRALSLPDNRAVVIWRDSRPRQNFYYQFVNSAGQCEFDPNGRPVFQDDRNSSTSEYDVCSDGDGGFYLVHGWELDDDAYMEAAHIGSDGSRLAEIELSAVHANYPGVLPRCVPSANGEFYAVWQEDRGTEGETNVLLLDSLLESSWPSPVLIANGNSSSLRGVAAMPDGACVVLWTAGPGILNATRVQLDGSILWTTEISRTANNYNDENAVVVSETGIVYVAWLDGRTQGISMDVYGQKLTSSGVPLLADSGVLMATLVDDFMVNPITLVYDDGLWMIYGKETGHLESNLYANKFDESLERVLGEDGVHLGAQQTFTFRQSTVADGEGGIFTAFGIHPETGGSIIRATHLNASGIATDPYWTENGVICDTLGAQYSPTVAAGVEPDQFFCFWNDSRTAGQLFGQYVDEEYSSTKPPVAPIVLQVSLSQNYPNPFNAATEIVFSLPRAMKATLQVYDVTGRLVRTLAEEQFMAGEHRIAFDAKDIASGIYFYELRAVHETIARKMLLLK